jgi:iron complex transport system ATP-binding protein
MSELKIQNLSITIAKKLFFDSLDVEFAPGKVWGILGPNGIGKTTLLHTIAGIRKPDGGQVVLEDQVVHALPGRKRAQKIGLLQQDYEFPFPSSVLETVLIGRYPYQEHWFYSSKLDKEIAAAAIEKMQLKGFEHRSVMTLSGGEKRRLMIATLLAQNPDICMLDEPTNHLDFEQQYRVLALFHKLAKEKNKAVIMILHNIEMIKMFCDYVMVIGYGEKNLCGKSREVLNDDFVNRFYPIEMREQGINNT